ncbi:PREDICTED: uncharacterized protein LOC105556593 [Vollenhovia emeryi]|uniref:uncharacterized protein LOC105556593 n=1 Tax=Vollenhovia emeryi TaxID=411798 RepID=UPI0005F3AEB4|nr:PREDICTED: uncharacterized protein LOC105556593 [Vollenhovia emeryi]
MSDANKTGWIQNLSKLQIIGELEVRGIKRKARATKSEEDNTGAANTGAEGEPFESGETNEGSDTGSGMSGDGAKLQFALERDDWEMFIEQLEFYILEKGIQDDKRKVATLMTRVDQEAFKLIKQLVAPERVADKKFEDVVKTVTAHFKPKPSEAMERCNFHRARQEANESIAEYAARLKKLSLHCNFDNLKTALRDQLVCGIKDTEIRVKLFEDESLDYDKALKTAIAHESAVKNAAASLGTLENKHQKADVYSIRREQQSKGQRGGRGRGRNYKDGRSLNKHDTAEREKASNKFQRRPSSKQGLECYCCGKANHVSRECRFRDYTCNKCGKRGHLARACRTTESGARQGKSDVNWFPMSRGDSERDEDRTASHQEEFFNVSYEDEKQPK